MPGNDMVPSVTNAENADVARQQADTVELRMFDCVGRFCYYSDLPAITGCQQLADAGYKKLCGHTITTTRGVWREYYRFLEHIQCYLP